MPCQAVISSALTLVAATAISLCQAQDLTEYVLPNMGATNGGNTFPGVSLPLGMVKLGPDLYTGSDSYSGYQPSGNFIGFSLLHESGTGGAPKYGVVAQMPVPGTIDNPLADLSVNRSKADESRLGYYKSSLFNGITVEMGATGRAGMYVYEFPEDSRSSNVVVDVSHVLPSYRGQGLGQTYLGGNITVTPTDDGIRYMGSGSYDNGWNRAPKWTVYFCGHFDQPATFRTFLGTSATGTTLDEYGDSTTQESKSRLGAVFTFNSTSITSRVGVSFISSEQACSSVQSEIPAGTELTTLEKGVKEAWSNGVLSKITTTDSSNTANLQLLYSSLYHLLLIPTNKTGENPLWESSEPYYDDIFTFWDTFRSHTPLLQILQPTAYEELIRSVIDVWRFEGFMPDARSSFFNGATQGGSNADNVLADAYVKGVRGAINWEDGFAAMVTDAETVPPNNNDPRDTSSSTKEGRGALPDWIKHGYITTKYRRSVSRAIEYALNDFALYQVAKGLNNETAAEKYLKRSRNWRNQWNPDLEALNFTGFLGPRDSSGNWVSQDPLSCGGCYWGDDYYQGLPMEYSFNAHHDVATLIKYSGGKDAFVARLEAMFMPGLSSGNSQFGHTLFNPGNEPSFATPYLFNFAGRQDLSVKYSRAVARSYYAPTESGLPGNSDAGAMESWVLWNMIGMYPLTGQTTFLIASPWFADLTIDLGGGKKLVITAENVGQESYYVQSLSVNGKSWDKAWVLWDDVFANGGTMEFVLGPEPADWATGDLPPSPASEA
ncbi:glycoside hydrolase family 92 protein [Xylaria bambusicola]|uniref:glycoside hydrolase family 92 protein n=1 Tax=Xylaria bambusicola TaxID=326684 RepID=UPI002008785E|nr:glycoside hydrolase family 92 protein [Xylaria bambusicola]KAI0506483.1 glycoside hydrolase family 92 protein [Xylaria bambusicola]